jgi:AraC-like DNA-binding protein
LSVASEHTFGHAIIGGARSSYYVKDITKPAHSVGVQLLPGACRILFGAGAGELAERHTRLDDVWGQSAVTARDRILAARTPEAQMAVLESILAAQLPEVRALHPAVAQALEQLGRTSGVREIVRASGYSHRAFLSLFREAVGLAPKLYSRVLRFQKVLERLEAEPRVTWVDLAYGAGYSDQPHFIREFREFAGRSPGELRRDYPWPDLKSIRHVPVAAPLGGTASCDRAAHGATARQVKSIQYVASESP